MNHRALLLILGTAFIVRLIAVPLAHATRYTSDEREYMFIAKQLLDQGVVRDSNGDRAIRAPLFPFLLAGILALTPTSLLLAHIIGCLLGTAVVGLTYGLAMRIWTDETGALIAAGIAALYPGLVIYSALLQTESLYIVFFLLALMIAYRLQESPRTVLAICFGVCCGAAALTRAVFAGFIPILLVLIIWDWRANRQTMVRIAFLGLLAVVLTIAPWTVRNARVLHAFVPVASGGGNALLTGNNPFATGTYRTGVEFETWFDDEARRRGVENPEELSETERSGLSAAVAWSFIFGHPVDALALAAKKTHIFWFYPITHTDSDVELHLLAVGSDAVLFMASVLGFLSVWFLRRRLIIPVAAVVFFWLVQTVLHAEARFRLPLIPLLALPAGWGVRILSDPERRRVLFADQRFRRSVLVCAGLLAAVYGFTGYLFLRGVIS